MSTRKVDDLMNALGLSGVSKSEVSRVCGERDELVSAFRNRPLEGEYPYLWLDATYLQVREKGRVVSMALVVGVRSTGEREILGHDLGPGEDGAFWLSFLQSLVGRGLAGLQLVTSDAHLGLRHAIPAAFGGACWQRCRVHFLRNVQGLVPKSAVPMVSGAVKTVFAQPDRDAAVTQMRRATESLDGRYPRVATLLEEASEDITAYMGFPNRQAAIRLVGAILAEQNDE